MEVFSSGSCQLKGLWGQRINRVLVQNVCACVCVCERGGARRLSLTPLPSLPFYLVWVTNEITYAGIEHSTNIY